MHESQVVMTGVQETQLCAMGWHSRTPSAKILTEQGAVRHAQMQNVTRPVAFVTPVTVWPETVMPAGCVGQNVIGHPVKSMSTDEPAIGLFAKSRTIMSKQHSLPLFGETVTRVGQVELGGLGTPAEATAGSSGVVSNRDSMRSTAQQPWRPDTMPPFREFRR